MSKLLHPGFGLGGRFDRTLELEVKPSFSFGSDEYWMEQALILSMNSVGLSPPNPSVGCILVRDQKILAQGFTQAQGAEHAERMAFLSLPQDLAMDEVTAYVTLEPCSHHGSQPPCADLFLRRPVRRVLAAIMDPDDRVNGQGIARLRAAGMEVNVGTLGREAAAFQMPFLFHRKKLAPVWIAKWAQTSSGYLADANGVSKWITGAKSRAYTHWLRQKYDAIVVGAATFIADSPALTARDCAGPHHRNPLRIVFDPDGILISQRVSATEGFEVFVQEKVLASHFAEVPSHFKVIPEGRASLIHRFQKAVEELPTRKPVQSVLVEGGARLLNSIFEQNGFDAVHRFTGVRNFEQLSARHRVLFEPDRRWNQIAEQKFDDDHLQEWVKEF